MSKIFKDFTWHPFLFAVYSILFMYTTNIKEVRFIYTLLPMLILLIFVFLSLKGVNLIVGDIEKAALITTLFLFFFFAYGHIFDALEIVNYTLGVTLIRNLYLVPFFLVVWFFLAYRTARAKMEFKVVTTILNIAMVCLIGINLVNILFFELNQNSAADKVKEQLNAVDIKSGGLPEKGEMPDIYHIVLDEYAGLEAIKEIYDYDNGGFAEALRKRGFYVAEKSETLYKLTEASIASTLNMRRLKEGEEPYQLLRNNTVTAILKKLGYKVVVFPFNMQTVFIHSDMVPVYYKSAKGTMINDFHLFILNNSMLRFLHDILMRRSNFSDYYRNQTLHILETLETVPGMEGPTFVYAHFDCPHFPFVFDENGGEVDPGHINDIRDKRYYLGQYKYISKRIIELVDILLEKSARPPVIVIQSDHGQRGNAPGNGKFRMEVGDTWKNILNTYYLPGVDKRKLHDSISPVETFPLILKSYFNIEKSPVTE